MVFHIPVYDHHVKLFIYKKIFHKFRDGLKTLRRVWEVHNYAWQYMKDKVYRTWDYVCQGIHTIMFVCLLAQTLNIPKEPQLTICYVDLWNSHCLCKIIHSCENKQSKHLLTMDLFQNRHKVTKGYSFLMEFSSLPLYGRAMQGLCQQDRNPQQCDHCQNAKLSSSCFLQSN